MPLTLTPRARLLIERYASKPKAPSGPNCGTGAGGFQRGNKCQKGGGSGKSKKAEPLTHTAAAANAVAAGKATSLVGPLAAKKIAALKAAYLKANPSAAARAAVQAGNASAWTPPPKPATQGKKATAAAPAAPPAPAKPAAPSVPPGYAAVLKAIQSGVVKSPAGNPPAAKPAPPPLPDDDDPDFSPPSKPVPPAVKAFANKVVAGLKAASAVKFPPDLDPADLKLSDPHDTEPTWANPPEKRSYGGVIMDDQGRVLLREPKNHFGNYHWTFAKGASNPGEHPVDAALREVKEETGVEGGVLGLVPGGFAGSTSSKAYMFLMRAKSHDPSHPTPETQGQKWATYEEAKALISETTSPEGKQRDLAILDAAYKHLADLKSGAVTGPVKFPASPHGLKFLGKLGGGTGAELVEDAHGNRFARKAGGSPGHVREENYADAVYRAAGLAVPASRLYEEPGQPPVKLAAFVEGKTLGELAHSDPAAADRAMAELRKGFVVDALLGNWDVVGANSDNVIVGGDGKLYRIDNGGSLRYRALGKKKTAGQWNGTASDLESMRNPAVNPSAAGVFGSLTDAEVRAQLQGVLKRKPAILAALPADVRPMFEARLASFAAALAPKTAYQTSPGGWTPTPADHFTEIPSHAHDDWGGKHYIGWAMKLPARQKATLKSYSNSDYRPMNNFLRGVPGYHGDPDHLQKKIDRATEALLATKVPEPVVAYRGVHEVKLLGVNSAHDLVPGQVIEEHGFASTSLSKEMAAGFSSHQGVLFKIHVPAGTPGAYLNAGNISDHPSEKELLLPPGQKFRVIGHEGEIDKYGSKVPVVLVERVP